MPAADEDVSGVIRHPAQLMGLEAQLLGGAVTSGPRVAEPERASEPPAGERWAGEDKVVGTLGALWCSPAAVLLHSDHSQARCGKLLLQ